jgi:hypothetical protein
VKIRGSRRSNLACFDLDQDRPEPTTSAAPTPFFGRDKNLKLLLTVYMTKISNFS